MFIDRYPVGKHHLGLRLRQGISFNRIGVIGEQHTQILSLSRVDALVEEFATGYQGRQQKKTAHASCCRSVESHSSRKK